MYETTDDNKIGEENSKIEKKKSWRGAPMAEIQIQLTKVDKQILNTITCTKIQMMTKLGGNLKN